MAVPTLALWLEEYPLQSVQFLRPHISLGLSMPLYILEHLAKWPATIVKLRMLCAQFTSLDLATLGGCWLRALQELTLDETEGSWNGRVALLGQVALLITPANVPALSLLRLVNFDTVYAEWRDIIKLKLRERCHLGTLQTLHDIMMRGPRLVANAHQSGTALCATLAGLNTAAALISRISGHACKHAFCEILHLAQSSMTRRLALGSST
ncbi:hypothetical protein C8J57DRAFT_1491843 [Mycena rebaudengoi]|nr:hypothetical protein C8J57DRAFT_1491843 [Mycena rebaudengoi]